MAPSKKWGSSLRPGRIGTTRGTITIFRNFPSEGSFSPAEDPIPMPLTAKCASSKSRKNAAYSTCSEPAVPAGLHNKIVRSSRERETSINLGLRSRGIPAAWQIGRLSSLNPHHPSRPPGNLHDVPHASRPVWLACWMPGLCLRLRMGFRDERQLRINSKLNVVHQGRANTKVYLREFILSAVNASLGSSSRSCPPSVSRPCAKLQ